MKKRRLHIVITTTLIGIFLWLSVALREQYQITVAAPLVIDEIPEGMAVRTPVPRKVHLRFRGDGWRLAGLLMGSDIDVHIPFTSLPQGDRTITMNEVAERIAYPSSIQLVSMQPDTVAVRLDRLSSTRVPVMPDFTVSFKEGYGQVGAILLSPDSVTVMGAQSVLDQITSWKTSRTSFNELKAPVEQMVSLAQSEGPMVSCSPSSVRIRINVQSFAEKVFSGLPVDVHGVPPNRDVIFIPPKMEIVARGGIRQLASVLPVDFQIGVPYDRILADTTGTIEPEVIAPSGIQVVARRPEKLQYVVRKRFQPTGAGTR
ncbi:MAG TPA: CdaR family protein [Bacteroidota bacterium]|nr:CdaR family protein [Bacteroidota bacterium]